MKTRLVLQRRAGFDLDGDLIATAVMTYDSPLVKGDRVTTNVQLSAPQPEGDWGNKAYLAAFVSAFPRCDVYLAGDVPEEKPVLLAEASEVEPEPES